MKEKKGYRRFRGRGRECNIISSLQEDRHTPLRGVPDFRIGKTKEWALHSSIKREGA